MTDRLFVADARTVSGAEFYRAVFGKPPMTEAERAERKRQAEAFWARRKAEDAEAAELMRQRVAEHVAAARAYREQLTEAVGDPFIELERKRA